MSEIEPGFPAINHQPRKKRDGIPDESPNTEIRRYNKAPPVFLSDRGRLLSACDGRVSYRVLAHPIS